MRVALAATLAAVVAAVLAPAGAASGQAPGGRLVFVSQTPWVPAGGEFTVRFRIERAVNPSNLEVHVHVHPAVATRSEFNETLRDRLESTPLPGMAPFPVASLVPDANGDLSATVRIQTPREPGRAVSLPPREGVHPVRVELRERGAGPVVDRFVTHLVHLPENHAGPKLGLSLTVPVHAPPAIRPDGQTWVAQEPLDAASLAMLVTRGFDRFVVAEDQLVALPDELLTLTRPFVLDARPTPVPAVAADAGLAAHFDNRGNQGLQAAHLLADLAVLYLDEPPLRRAVVAVPPRTWRPDPTFLAAVWAGLAANPVAEAVSLDAIFSSVPSAQTQLGNVPMVRRLAVRPPGNLSEVVEHVRDLRQELDSLGSVLGAGNAVSARLDERLLVAQSADLADTRQRRPYLSGVASAIDDELGQIQMPTNRSITLTARRAQIPVTFQNRTGHPVKVVVRMQSDKLDFPAGTEQVLELTRLNTTERFPVVTRTSGAFPIRITLESPDGRLEVGRARLTVRSTAASSVSLGISLGAVLFLALWWGRHAIRGRRARRLVPA